ncbi:MAG: hypothetical protein NTNFB02_08530 [Nitrospira sp.]
MISLILRRSVATFKAKTLGLSYSRLTTILSNLCVSSSGIISSVTVLIMVSKHGGAGAEEAVAESEKTSFLLNE